MRFYIILMICALVFGAYFSGRAVGRVEMREKCKVSGAVQYVQTIKQREKVNEQTNHTAVRDIRRILREKYTIAE